MQMPGQMAMLAGRLHRWSGDMRKILVIIDPEETRHSALNRIKELPVNNIQFRVDYYLRSPNSAENTCAYSDMVAKKSKWLETLVQPLRDIGYEIETKVQLFYRLYESIIQSAYEYNADFVFKPLRKHGALTRALFTSTDWNLVRFCPCPLLLVNHANQIKGNPVIAAVDLASHDAAHKELNQIVLNQTKVLADVLNADMHLVHAYNVVVLPTGYAISDPMAYQITTGRRDEQFNKAHKLAEICDVSSKNVHVGEGTAEQVVNRCASEISAGVIVVGTVARSGPYGLFIGNTAESIMESARSDVLVVKQANFESPIKAAG